MDIRLTTPVSRLQRMVEKIARIATVSDGSNKLEQTMTLITRHSQTVTQINIPQTLALLDEHLSSVLCGSLKRSTWWTVCPCPAIDRSLNRKYSLQWRCLPPRTLVDQDVPNTGLRANFKIPLESLLTSQRYSFTRSCRVLLRIELA